jgi:hypothetical protein
VVAAAERRSSSVIDQVNENKPDARWAIILNCRSASVEDRFEGADREAEPFEEAVELGFVVESRARPSHVCDRAEVVPDAAIQRASGPATARSKPMESVRAPS